MTKTLNFKRKVTATKNPNVVKVTETYDLPRYIPQIINDSFECEETVREIMECCKIYTSKVGDYAILNNVDLDPNEIFTGKTLEEDRKNFQKYLNKEFGKNKYEAFVLGAYIHSGTSFSVNKVGNHVCRWDSSQLGFIGLQKGIEDVYSNKNPDKVAKALTAAWEGEFNRYEVIDTLNDETVEELTTCDYNEANKFSNEMKEKYNVDFDECKVIY